MCTRFKVRKPGLRVSVCMKTGLKSVGKHERLLKPELLPEAAERANKRDFNHL